MKIVWIILGIFLVVGFLMIKGNSDLTESEERKGFLSESFSWIKGLGNNMLSIVGYSVKELDWLPGNNTED